MVQYTQVLSWHLDVNTIVDIMSGQVSGRVSGQVRQRLSRVLQIIYGGSLNTNQIAEILGEPVETVRKDINRLKDWGVIWFKGAPKSGGYVLSERALEHLAR